MAVYFLLNIQNGKGENGSDGRNLYVFFIQNENYSFDVFQLLKQIFGNQPQV